MPELVGVGDDVDVDDGAMALLLHHSFVFLLHPREETVENNFIRKLEREKSESIIGRM